MAKGLKESGPLQILKKLMTIDNERLVQFNRCSMIICYCGVSVVKLSSIVFSLEIYCFAHRKGKPFSVGLYFKILHCSSLIIDRSSCTQLHEETRNFLNFILQDQF